MTLKIKQHIIKGFEKYLNYLSYILSCSIFENILLLEGDGNMFDTRDEWLYCQLV